MTNQEKWNLIVEQHKSYFYEPESKVQKTWEDYCSELFGYRKVFGEIDAQRSVHIGSSERAIPDIILKRNNNDVFDIELKKYSLAFDISFQDQLISYLKLTNLSVGMIVCSDIYLYHYNYGDDIISKIQINIVEDNPDGIKLVELLSKDIFSADDIYTFIEEKNKKENDIQSIRQELKPQLIKELVADYFKKSYSEEIVEKAINGINFSVSHSFHLPDNTQNSIVPIPGNNRRIVADSNIVLYLRNWCKEKNNQNLILWDSEKTSDTYFRFKTTAMDSLIPTSIRERSGWGNNQFYYYEIHFIRASNRIKMQLAFSRKNAPSEVNDAFEKIFRVTGKTPANSDWEWKLLLSTNSVSCNSISDEDEAFKQLDIMFNSLMAEEQKIINLISR